MHGGIGMRYKLAAYKAAWGWG